MSDLRHEAEACRRLWLAVAEKAVVEACTAIVRRSGALDDAVAREMRYFHSKGWRRIERKALADGAKARTEVLWMNWREDRLL